MQRRRTELRRTFHSLVLGDFCTMHMHVIPIRLNLTKLPMFDNF